MVGDDWGWRHDDVDGPNGPSHGRASLAGCQVLDPACATASPALGRYQAIFLCEFDGPEAALGLRQRRRLVAAPPVRRDDELELTIDSLAFGGNGVARLDGFVVFVRAGLPGDRVRARVTKVQRRHAEAITTEVLAAGPLRVEAPCAHYPACGGCRFQDLAYEAQLAAKQAWVVDSLSRIAGIADPPVRADRRRRGASSATATRWSTRSAVGPRGRPSASIEPGRWDEVLELEHCHLTTPLGNRIRNLVRDWAREERLAPYDARSGEGYLRQLVVREGRNTGQALVQLVTTAGERFDRERLIEVLAQLPELRSLQWAVNDSAGHAERLDTSILFGEEAIEEEIGGLRFRVRPGAFLQTNTPHGRAALRDGRRGGRALQAARPSTTSTAASARSAFVSHAPR